MWKSLMIRILPPELEMSSTAAGLKRGLSISEKKELPADPGRSGFGILSRKGRFQFNFPYSVRHGRPPGLSIECGAP
jgi:hypothetical protein